MRAGALVLFTAIMPAVALVGPNTIYGWVCPTTEEIPLVAAASSQSVSPKPKLHLVEHPAVAESAVAPKLSPAVSASLNQPVAAAVPAELQAEAAEFRYRESSPSANNDRMQQIQQRLQLLGARYMVLETWGDITPSYRFYCRMPDRWGRENEHEAIGGDPLQAMQRVLGEVEQHMARR